MKTIEDLSAWLVVTVRKSMYPLVYKLIVLVLTLPISTATDERAFSVMKLIKTRLRTSMHQVSGLDAIVC